jgi:hypothetical protein
MTWKTTFFSAAVLMVLGAGSAAWTTSFAETSGCAAGEKIDGSSAPEATRKIERAGFQQVRELKKGCDNFWHGVAVKDGGETHVVLTPQGQVMREEN